MTDEMADFGLTTQFAVTAEDTTSLMSDVSTIGTTSEAENEPWKNFLYVNISVRLFMGLLAVSSNFLTVVAIARYEYLRSCTNYLIAALAISDMISGFTSILLFINYLVPMTDELWLNMCVVEHTLNQVSAGLNLVYILVVSLDRLIFISFPLRYFSLVTPRLIVGAILLPWVLIGGHLLIILFMIEEFVQPPGHICIGVFPKSVSFSSHIWFYGCNATTVLIYTRIAWIAYRQRIAIEQAQNITAKKEYKITKMLSLVLGVYMACYMPQFMTYAVEKYLAPVNYVVIERVSSWFWWINSFANPLIYAWKNKEFNRAFRGLLGLKNPTINPMQGNPAI